MTPNYSVSYFTSEQVRRAEMAGRSVIICPNLPFDTLAEAVEFVRARLDTLAGFAVLDKAGRDITDSAFAAYEA